MKVSAVCNLILSAVVVTAAGCGQFQTVSVTPNPLVAAYSITPRQPGSIIVEFGKDQTYGLSTSPQSVTGSPVTILVAGMQASTTYHMRSVLTTLSGEKIYDADRVFTTGKIPANALPTVTAGPTGGNTPQPGVELVNPILSYNKPFRYGPERKCDLVLLVSGCAASLHPLPHTPS